MSKWLSLTNWLKKNWSLVVFPVGLVLFLLRFLKPKVVVASPELQGHAELKQRLAEESDKKREEVEAHHKASSEQAAIDYQKSVVASQREADEKAQAVQNDPISLNSYLKSTGRKVRGSGR